MADSHCISSLVRHKIENIPTTVSTDMGWGSLEATFVMVNYHILDSCARSSQWVIVYLSDNMAETNL